MGKTGFSLRLIKEEFSVCKTAGFSEYAGQDFWFSVKTDGEFSLVCKTADKPKNALLCEDGWRCFFIDGALDFSLIGIISEITAALAERKIAVFVQSTFDTDYVLVKKEKLEEAISALEKIGFSLCDGKE